MRSLVALLALYVALSNILPAEGGAFNISVGTADGPGSVYFCKSNPDLIFMFPDFTTFMAVDLKKEQIIWNFTDKYWKNVIPAPESLIVRGDGVYSLAPETGKVLWHFKLQTKASVDMEMTLGLVNSQTYPSIPIPVVYVFESPSLYALDITNGKIMWSNLLPNNTRASFILANNVTTGVVLASEDFLYSFDGDGQLIGLFSFDSTWTPTIKITEQFLVIIILRDTMQAYDARKSFALVWNLTVSDPASQFKDFQILPGTPNLAYIQYVPLGIFNTGPRALSLVDVLRPQSPLWTNNQLNSTYTVDADALVVQADGNVYWMYASYLKEDTNVIIHISVKDGQLLQGPVTVPGLLAGITSSGLAISTTIGIDAKNTIFTTIFSTQV